MKVLSFDPGGTTGYCYQDPDNIWIMAEILDTRNRLGQFLKAWDTKAMPVDRVVIEGYKILGHQASANIGIRLVTVEAIGKIEGWAEMNDIPVTIQMPEKKPAYEKLTGKSTKGMRKDITHKFDAYNHGRAWLIINEHAKSALELEMGI